MDRLDWNQSEKPLRLTRWVNFVGQVSVELARAQANKTPGNTVNKTSTLTSGPADLKDYSIFMTTLGGPTASSHLSKGKSGTALVGTAEET